MNPLAEAVMGAESARYTRSQVEGKRKGAIRRTRQASAVRECNSAITSKPWNRMDVTLKLHMSDSVRAILRQLDERDWQAKYGKL